MASRQLRKDAIVCEINITPLTDVFLVLLVIVMIVAPVLSHSQQEIKPPSITQGEGIDKEWPTVEIAKDGTPFFDGRMTSLAELPSLLSAQLIGLEERKLVVRGDVSARSQAVLEVMRIAREAGFEQAFIAGVATADLAGQTASPVPAAPASATDATAPNTQ